MKFQLVIDPEAEECITACVHQPSELTEQIERLVLQYGGADRVYACTEEGERMLPYRDIECITVLDGKTYAIDKEGKRNRLRLRLYEVEKQLPGSFIRINKSSLANEACIERFAATFGGAVDVVFRCGYRDYVSRRCFAAIRRRYHK